MKRFHGKGIGRRLGAAAICLILLLGLVPCAMADGGAQEEQSGSLNVRLALYDQLPDDAVVRLILYRIGDADPSAASSWRLRDDLADYGVLQARTASELGEIAGAIASAIRGTENGVTRALNAGGSATYAGLQPGVYLGALGNGPQGLTITPFIVTIPTVDETTREVVFDYDVNVKAQYTPVVPQTEIGGQKIWIDEANAHKTRPESISLKLYANGAPLEAEPTWSDTETDAWSYTFGAFPAVDKNGAAIAYTVEEIAVQGYETEVEGTTVTNTLIPRETEEYTTISGVKTWWGDEGRTRPDAITVYLMQDGVLIAQYRATAEDGWRYTFENVPVDDGYGNYYTYAVREGGAPGYYARVDGYSLSNYALPDTPCSARETPPFGRTRRRSWRTFWRSSTTIRRSGA